MSFPPPVGCPHCRQPVGFDPRLAGMAVSCPYCRAAFQMPTYAPPPAAMPHPAYPQHHAAVRVRVTRNGLAYEGYRPMPDVNAVVALFPTAGAVKAPMGVLYTMGDRAQFDQAKRRLEGRGIAVGLVGGDGQALLSPVRPGEYHLFIKSASAPCLDERRVSAAIDRFFESGDDGTGNPFDFTNDFAPLRQLQQQSVAWAAVHVSSILVAPGSPTEYSHHFV